MNIPALRGIALRTRELAPAWRRRTAITAAAAWVAVAAVLAGVPAAGASPRVVTAVPRPAEAATAAAAIWETAHYGPALARAVQTHRPATSYTVRSGDTLSAISARFCGSPASFPRLAAANSIRNPDRIYPGRTLRISCHARITTVAATRHAHSGGRIWKVTYGYPYRCGDGDGDGWDRPCHHATRYASARPLRVTRAYAGHYSYTGLRSLWMSAGGPAWAASHAASIAMCESGGNVYAHNPSGASGLWQILGQVISGNLYNPYVNAANAVAKFRASGNSFAQWVCR